MRKVLSVGLLVLLVLVAGIYMYGAYVVHQHRNAVRAELKDPDSAQFRNERLVNGWTVKTSILCGEVNAKNELGGYSGFKLFASTSGESADVEKDVGSKVFIEGYCSK